MRFPFFSMSYSSDGRYKLFMALVNHRFVLVQSKYTSRYFLQIIDIRQEKGFYFV